MISRGFWWDVVVLKANLWFAGLDSWDELGRFQSNKNGYILKNNIKTTHVYEKQKRKRATAWATTAPTAVFGSLNAAVGERTGGGSGAHCSHYLHLCFWNTGCWAGWVWPKGVQTTCSSRYKWASRGGTSSVEIVLGASGGREGGRKVGTEGGSGPARDTWTLYERERKINKWAFFSPKIAISSAPRTLQVAIK